MSDTPRTDDAIRYYETIDHTWGYVMPDFARTLERELAERDAEIVRLQAEIGALRIVLSDTPA